MGGPSAKAGTARQAARAVVARLSFELIGRDARLLIGFSLDIFLFRRPGGRPRAGKPTPGGRGLESGCLGLQRGPWPRVTAAAARASRSHWARRHRAATHRPR